MLVCPRPFVLRYLTSRQNTTQYLQESVYIVTRNSHASVKPNVRPSLFVLVFNPWNDKFQIYQGQFDNPNICSFAKLMYCLPDQFGTITITKSKIRQLFMNLVTFYELFRMVAFYDRSPHIFYIFSINQIVADDAIQ